MIMHFSNEFISKKLKIDDPLNVIGIHGFAGAWGTIALALFTASPKGLSFVEFFIVQTLGVIVAFIFSFILGLILFLILYKYKFLRVKKRNEVIGLNTSEHNAKLPWVETIESIVTIMKTGNLNKKIYEERDTEVGIVAKFFNYLLNMLKERNENLKKSNRSLHKKAYFDSLTKVLNRRGFLEKMKHKPYGDNYSVIIADIDKFKTINDTYGHDIGDIILSEFAEVIGNKIRLDDIFARWGGEEFILIINTSSLNAVQNIAEKIRLDIEKTKFTKVGKVTASFGVSSFTSSNNSFEDVFKNADDALYQAKKLGRNRVYCY